MDFAAYLDQIRQHSDALRSAAVAAGPDAEVPSCPGWTVQRLVRHIGRVHGYARVSLTADPRGPRPEAPEQPETWDEILPWWDTQRGTLLDTLAERGADAPAWIFLPGVAGTASWWARRQAHETAIHRLDAELVAAAESPAFGTEFAADGVDELLTMVAGRGAEATAPATALFHAADAGRAWLARLTPGEPAVIGPADEAALDTDASVVGTADAVYRAVWGRPSTAVVTGDRGVLHALRAS